MYRAIDLFAGIGGIRLGFDQGFRTPIETVFVSEWNPKAVETYTANFGASLPVHGDITTVDEHDIPAHDLLLAGFPCQAFSIAGKRRGFEDTRGTLFFDVARIIQHHQPNVVFIENVKNLSTHDKGRTFGVIQAVLADLGYTTWHAVLNSKHFGVPQNRERIYVVGFINEVAPATFTFPTSSGEPACIGDILEEREVSAKYYLSDTYLQSLVNHKARHAAKGHGFGYEIREHSAVAGAIVCGGMGRERNLIIDERLSDPTPVTHIKGAINSQFVRRMTPREWARLQGFPDSYVLPVADTHLYQQFGNSVTVPVIRAIAREIERALDASA